MCQIGSIWPSASAFGAQHVEYGPGLAVQNRASAGVGHRRQGAQQRRVVQHHAVVRLVHLKGGDTRRHDIGHFVQALGVGRMPGRDRHVQAVVDGNLAVGLGAALFEGMEQRLLRLRRHEVDHGRRAAAGGGDRAGAEAVGADQASQRHLQVHMVVDGARDHVAAGGIDDLVAVQVAPDGDDLLVGDRQVGLDGAVAGDEKTVADDKS